MIYKYEITKCVQNLVNKLNAVTLYSYNKLFFKIKMIGKIKPKF